MPEALGRRPGGGAGRCQRHLQIGGEPYLPGAGRAGESLPAATFGPCPLPVRLPRRHLPPRPARPQHAGGVAGCGGGHWHQCPRLPRGARHRRRRQRGRRLLAPVPGQPQGARPRWHPAGDLRRPPGADGGDQADVPGL